MKALSIMFGYMTTNPHAVALGRLGRGHPKTMSPAAIRQRQQAAKQPKRKRKAK
jgi:hypothetical protein